jgi:hypothetical protein
MPCFMDARSPQFAVGVDGSYMENDLRRSGIPRPW